MKIYLALLFSFWTASLSARPDTAATGRPMHATYMRHSITPTVSLGFIDAYRNNYTLPVGFQKNNTSGFAPVYVKLEYRLGAKISVAATLGYDAFNYNFRQKYEGNNGPFVRNRTDAVRVFSGGVAAFYHLGDLIKVKRLDPFVGLGVSINNIRHNAFPQGDSVSIYLDHTATVSVRAGARYYLSDKFSLYGDVGYDKLSVFSLGFSCRFLPDKKKISQQS